MNPFPGLRPFLEEEAHLFFGREQQVGAMLAKLARTHFLTVVGTSGCGKSSLVNCGLLPALHGGAMGRERAAWRVAHFRPGNDPIGAMARALAKDGVLYSKAPEGLFSLVEIVESTLRMSRMGLIDVWQQAHRGADESLLVVVDQFEELFRFHAVGTVDGPTCGELGDEATAFVNLLLEVRSHPSIPIYVVLTMRSDFLGDTAQLAGLPEAINEGQYLVPRMTREERKRAIEGPVQEVDATMSPVLLTRLVNDVGDNADQLSILQHALNRTWAQWQKQGGSGALDLPEYQAIGTMALALDRHAEKAYGELTTDEDREICAKLFKALTDKATDSRGIRRPTTVATLCALTGATIADLERVMAVFRKPSRSFLMPPAGETLLPETVVDISHESLMRVWERLRNWSDEEAQSALTYRRLAETARLHAADKASLWRGRDLEGALSWREEVHPTPLWAERYAPGFDAAMEFLEKCVAGRKAEEAERLATQYRTENAEFETAETRRRYRRFAVVASIVFAVLVVVASQLYLIVRANRRTLAATAREETANARQAEAAKAIARARASQERANELQTTVTKQIVQTGALFEGAREAVKQFSVNPEQPLDRSEVAQRFDALTRVSALADDVPRVQRSGITVEYFRKPTDATDVGAALEQLGFKVDSKTMINPNVTNAIWYGAEVPEDSVKLVAFALIRAGYDLVGIQPQSDPSIKRNVIQVGHNGRLAEEKPFTAEEIGATPVAQLQRVETDAPVEMEGTVNEVTDDGGKGTIATDAGPVAFELPAGAPRVVPGQKVRFTAHAGRDRRRVARGVAAVAPPAGASDQR
jgi:energy-coupling factor transporter ATP-binding protein EcfA2/cold shock CspA family protein